MGSVYFHFKEKKRFEFSYMVRKVQNVPISFDVFARYQFHRAVWFGMGLNSIQHINLEFGVLLDSRGSRNYNQYKIVFSLNPIGPSYRLAVGDTFKVSLVYLME